MNALPTREVAGVTLRPDDRFLHFPESPYPTLGVEPSQGEERDEEQWTGQEVWEHHDAPLEHTAWEPDPLTPRRGGVANVSLHLPAFQDEIEHETCPNG